MLQALIDLRRRNANDPIGTRNTDAHLSRDIVAVGIHVPASVCMWGAAEKPPRFAIVLLKDDDVEMEMLSRGKTLQAHPYEVAEDRRGPEDDGPKMVVVNRSKYRLPVALYDPAGFDPATWGCEPLTPIEGDYVELADLDLNEEARC